MSKTSNMRSELMQGVAETLGRLIRHVRSNKSPDGETKTILNIIDNYILHSIKLEKELRQVTLERDALYRMTGTDSNQRATADEILKGLRQNEM